MTKGKEYLLRLRYADLRVQAKSLEIQKLKELATCTGSVSNADKLNVISSPSGDSLVNKIINYADKEAELNTEIQELIDLRHRIINEIYSLKENTFIELLFKRYVENKQFERIACEMSYSYERIRHMHSDALKAFELEILSTQ